MEGEESNILRVEQVFLSDIVLILIPYGSQNTKKRGGRGKKTGLEGERGGGLE